MPRANAARADAASRGIHVIGVERAGVSVGAAHADRMSRPRCGIAAGSMC